MKRVVVVVGFVTSFLLPGCASITKGTTQAVAVNTIPQGASCVLNREGDGTIGNVALTPGNVSISKSSKNIQVTCEKAGYQPTTAVMNSELEVMSAGNLIFGGIVGIAIDAGTGAMNKYDGAITVPLTPNGQQAPAITPPTGTKPKKPIS
ncbi:MAG: hypothetical protein AAGJ70_01730 [Pseudomonadota bacterium]